MHENKTTENHVNQPVNIAFVMGRFFLISFRKTTQANKNGCIGN